MLTQKTNDTYFLVLIHLSRRLIGELIGKVGLCRPSVVCTCRLSVRRPHSLNIFSSKTTKPIEAKFHIESPWDEGTKFCSNGPGQGGRHAHIWYKP